MGATLLVTRVRLKFEADESRTRTSLSEVFTLAFRNSGAVAISEQSIAQARALYRRALGSSLPTIGKSIPLVSRSAHQSRLAATSRSQVREPAGVWHPHRCHFGDSLLHHQVKKKGQSAGQRQVQIAL